MYTVDISPVAEEVLRNWVNICLNDNGLKCANSLIDAYEHNISLLEEQPLIGCGRLRFIPDKYRVFPLWQHLWFVFQIYENEKVIKIDYIIDDRQNYGHFII